MRNPKDKGTGFERKMCQALSLWWSQGNSDTIFWRTAGSGARATRRSQKNLATRNQYGDVCALDMVGQPLLDLAVIELKRGYPKASLMDLLDKPKDASEQVYEHWIKRVQSEVRLAGSIGWMIVVQRDRKEPIVLVNGPVYDVLGNSGLHDPNLLTIFDMCLGRTCVPDSWIYAFPLEYLFRFVKVDKLKHLLGAIDPC